MCVEECMLLCECVVLLSILSIHAHIQWYEHHNRTRAYEHRTTSVKTCLSSFALRCRLDSYYGPVARLHSHCHSSNDFFPLDRCLCCSCSSFVPARELLSLPSVTHTQPCSDKLCPKGISQAPHGFTCTSCSNPNQQTRIAS